MKSQKSAELGGGKLFLVGTPIGNLEDMTFRAIRILKEVDVIAAEDTRNTIKLCNHFDIKTRLISYHEHNTEVGGEKILAMLAQGNSVALVSDAGMPCISDPGADIAEKAIAAGYDVVPIPGANAAISALIASGLSPQSFLFHGFLSRNKKERHAQIEILKNRAETVILYEAPHRLKETIRALAEQVEGTRRITLARELTKRFEEFLRGTLEEALLWVESNHIRGEFCIVLERSEGIVVDQQDEVWWTDLSVQEHVTALVKMKELSSKDAIREVAADRALARREVYRAYHIEN